MKEFEDFLSLLYSDDSKEEMRRITEECADKCESDSGFVYVSLRNDEMLDYKLRKYHEWLIDQLNGEK